MKLKKMLEMDFIKEFREHLETDFEYELLYASLRNYCSHGNPLRLNNFAYAMRELINHVLKRLAPDERVMASPWFTKNKNNATVTRKQQAKYIAQKHIPDQLLDEAALEILEAGIGWFNKNYASLNDYTHISEHSFDSNPKLFFERAKLLIQLCNKIFDDFDELERLITESIIEEVQNEVNEVTRNNIPDELDILSSQTTVDWCNVASTELLSLDEVYIYLLVRGTVEITRQYGRGEDYFAQGDSYPFKFAVSIRTDNFNAISPLLNTAVVDTGSWYDDGEGSAHYDTIYTTRRFLAMISHVHIKPSTKRKLFPELNTIVALDTQETEGISGSLVSETLFSNQESFSLSEF
ncbi:hypothetical protein HGO41_17305 [Rahnella sp. CG8]|uniref:pPIWI-associating nuclease domain-containing protein n=1 Tax=Yersiniaceae TaxID=1903411 RepID=UPI001013CC4C|nr:MULTISPECIES: hypothetical protein [Yersiniaceae]MCM2446913.1 hypothetical protein [Rahnella sp. CG8]